ncbi:MAG: hypothetical protein ABL907_23540 [Hyphomicrobium sp.]
MSETMREETRRKLNRAIWRERAKYAGMGVAILAAIGLYMGYQSLDLAVVKSPVAGVIETIEPLIAPNVVPTGTSDGVTLGVKLDSGGHVRVIAYKSRHPHVGDRIDVIENRHGTGRVTHTLK